MISAIAKKKIDRALRKPIGNERISCREFGLSLATGVYFERWKAHRFILVQTIVVYPAYRNQGLCRSIFEYLESKNKNIYVERVTSTKLRRILKNRKYKSTIGSDCHLAMYQIVKEDI